MLAAALEQAGFELAPRFRIALPGDENADLWVSLGGPMAAYQRGELPFLEAELAVMRHRLACGLPILGVCLGAQLLATAAGALVVAGTAGFELGVSRLELTADGHADPVFGNLCGELEGAHWHGDTFGTVPGTQMLAGTTRYPHQAFRLNESYGLQFHPELDADSFRAWVHRLPEEVAAAKADPDSLSLQADRLTRCEALPELLRRLATHFARVGTQRRSTQR